MTISSLPELCRQLQLSTVANSILQNCEQAQRQQQPYDSFLIDLLQQELDSRLERRTSRRIKEAKFPWVKTLVGYAAAQQGYAVRFIMASQLVNLLVEAKDSGVLSAITQRFSHYKLLILDELGYLPLSKVDSELLFQVISQRQERLPIIITTNLPFSEWTSIFPDQRLCKALIDRITHHAHIIDTGRHSARLEETVQQKRR